MVRSFRNSPAKWPGVPVPAEANVSGCLLGQRLGELRHRRIRRLGRHDQRERHHRGERDRHQVLLGVVGEPLDPVLVDGDLAGLAHQQRVAVGRRRHHRLRADGAGRAGAVLDHDGLAERFGERHRDQARDDVAGAARRIGDDDVDGAVRESLAPRPERRRRSQAAATRQSRMNIFLFPPAAIVGGAVGAVQGLGRGLIDAQL